MRPIRPDRPDLISPRAYRAEMAFFHRSIFIPPSFSLFFPKERMND